MIASKIEINRVVGGHSGVQKTYRRLASELYCKGIDKDEEKMVSRCEIFQWNIYLAMSPGGLLQSLAFPGRVWEDISIYFIDGLPHSKGFTIDGVTEAIVSDRDEMFLGYFWRELFRLQGIVLKWSTTYHPQTDGYTKVISSKVLYGRDPPHLVHFGSSNSLVFSMEEYLEERDRVLEELKRHLLRAKHIMKKKGDGHRKDIPFEVGERVFFKLRSYRQKTVTNRRNEKLAPRYVRPYEVLEKVEAIAYWLKLSPTTTIHSVFHVSKLRRVIDDYTASSELLVSLTEDLEVVLEPLELMGVC
ncbi:hypothetical protein KFK09_014847 [Dendrobium nobile]|uniref:Uncharacterized protein n=1 Tax=Dendrobium nobile TaxID=94219 RepID=A0A8T3B5J9_DENNO|nr:hypothetical protein KFK09_014847 [Dendrobium nobile]